MTIAVDWDVKNETKQNKQKPLIASIPPALSAAICWSIFSCICLLLLVKADNCAGLRLSLKLETYKKERKNHIMAYIRLYYTTH